MSIALYNDIDIVVAYVVGEFAGIVKKVFVTSSSRDATDSPRNAVYIVVNVWDEISAVFNFVVLAVVVIRAVEVLLKSVLFFPALPVNVVKEDDSTCVETVEFLPLDDVLVSGFLVVFTVNGTFIVGY